MLRLTSAPSVVVATVWADLLGEAGIAATVQRSFSDSVPGGFESLGVQADSPPEVWLMNEAELAEAECLLHRIGVLATRSGAG